MISPTSPATAVDEYLAHRHRVPRYWLCLATRSYADTVLWLVELTPQVRRGAFGGACGIARSIRQVPCTGITLQAAAPFAGQEQQLTGVAVAGNMHLACW